MEDREDPRVPPIRVHTEDQARLLHQINRYVTIINALGTMLIAAGVHEETIKRVIADV